MKRKTKHVHKYVRLKLVLVYFIIIGIFLCVMIRLYFSGGKQMQTDYELGIKYFNAGKYESAKTTFDKLGDYEDSLDYLRRCDAYMSIDDMEQRYAELENVPEKEKIKELKNLVRDINNFDSEYVNADEEITNAIAMIKDEATYSLAVALYSEKDYEEALKQFQYVKDYGDSSYYIAQITVILYPDAQKVLYENAEKYLVSGDYQSAMEAYEELGDYKDSLDKADYCKRFVLARTVSAGIRGTAFLNSSRKIERKGEILKAIKTFDDHDGIISISAKDAVLVVLDENGKVCIYGANIGENEKELLSSFDNVIQAVAGELYAVVLSADGSTYAVGHGGDGQKDINESWNGYVIKEVACGWRTTVGLTDKGGILVEGYRKEKLEEEIKQKAKELTGIVHISAGGGGDRGKGHILALKEDHTVVAVGDKTQGQCNVGEWEDVIAISAGDFHSVGLRYDGDVYITTADGYVLKSFPEKIVSISAGYGYSIFIGESGKAYTEDSSFNKQGQIDDIDNWDVYLN